MQSSRVFSQFIVLALVSSTWIAGFTGGLFISTVKKIAKASSRKNVKTS